MAPHALFRVIPKWAGRDRGKTVFVCLAALPQTKKTFSFHCIMRCNTSTPVAENRLYLKMRTLYEYSCITVVGLCDGSHKTFLSKVGIRGDVRTTASDGENLALVFSLLLGSFPFGRGRGGGEGGLRNKGI